MVFRFKGQRFSCGDADYIIEFKSSLESSILLFLTVLGTFDFSEPTHFAIQRYEGFFKDIWQVQETKASNHRSYCFTFWAWTSSFNIDNDHAIRSHWLCECEHSSYSSRWHYCEYSTWSDHIIEISSLIRLPNLESPLRFPLWRSMILLLSSVWKNMIPPSVTYSYVSRLLLMISRLGIFNLFPLALRQVIELLNLLVLLWVFNLAWS